MAAIHNIAVKAHSPFFFIYYLPRSLLRPQSSVAPTYSPSVLLKNGVCHFYWGAHASSVSIIAAVMQDVGKAHKCQILFSHSGYMSVALCGLSPSRVLQRGFLKPKPSAAYKSHNNLHIPLEKKNQQPKKHSKYVTHPNFQK